MSRVKPSKLQKSKAGWFCRGGCICTRHNTWSAEEESVCCKSKERGECLSCGDNGMDGESQ